MKRIFLLFLIPGVIVFISGCGGAKIVIPSYTAPKEAAKLSQIETKDEFISDGAYLALYLSPDVKGTKKTNPKLSEMLIDEVKAKLTETNFIALDPLGGDDGVSLSMKVTNYEYKHNDKKVSIALEVTFTLSRGVDEFLVKKYKARKNRQSRDPSKLPSENELASAAVQKVVKYFISDISPLKTHQLREFKPFASPLKQVLTYVERKNYKDAIKMMNNYKGSKDMDYHYNLAILYEAQASESENLKLLKQASIHYEKALKMGGSKDKLVMDAKARFDNFYTLLSKTKKQNKANQALIQDRNSMLESSDAEYE